jgi:hypothetical protein
MTALLATGCTFGHLDVAGARRGEEGEGAVGEDEGVDGAALQHDGQVVARHDGGGFVGGGEGCGAPAFDGDDQVPTEDGIGGRVEDKLLVEDSLHHEGRVVLFVVLAGELLIDDVRHLMRREKSSMK